MARNERDHDDCGTGLAPEFDADALVDEMVALSEWMRDRWESRRSKGEDSRCPRS